MRAVLAALLLTFSFTAFGFAHSITPQKGAKMVKEQKAIVIDVREKAELKSGMAEPARWVPNSSFKNNGPKWLRFLAEIKKDKKTPILVYCAVGGRASAFVSYLRNNGFTAYNMGGFRDWKVAGLPVKPHK